MKYVVLVSLVCFLVSAQSLPMLELKAADNKADQNLGNLAELAESLGLTYLLKALEVAKIADILTMKVPLTLFGPTNEAFETIPEIIIPLLKNETYFKEVLYFHFVKSVVYAGAIKNELLIPSILEKPKKSIRFNVYNKGKVVTAQCSPIIKVNQNASNGVIHVVSRVMIPPVGTVVDLVVKEKQYLGILLTAVLDAKLQGVLAGAGPFTVFAPSNNAFAKIPPEKLKEILANIPLLTKILKYHVVSGTFCSAGLTDEQTLPTLEGSDVTIHISGGLVSVNNASVEFADAPVSNGVVHVIDTVLIPKDVNF